MPLHDSRVGIRETPRGLEWTIEKAAGWPYPVARSEYRLEPPSLGGYETVLLRKSAWGTVRAELARGRQQQGCLERLDLDRVQETLNRTE